MVKVPLFTPDLSLADLAVLLRDAGYDVRQLPAGTAAVGDALVVAAKDPA
jgi:hypothetical protein